MRTVRGMFHALGWNLMRVGLTASWSSTSTSTPDELSYTSTCTVVSSRQGA